MFNQQMHLIRGIRFAKAVLVSECPTSGSAYEEFAILTGGVVDQVYPMTLTKLGKESACAGIVDPVTGVTVFLTGLNSNAKVIRNLTIGTVIHAVGVYSEFRRAPQVTLVGFLDDAPLIEDGRFISSKAEADPVENATDEYGAVPARLSDETLQ